MDDDMPRRLQPEAIARRRALGTRQTTLRSNTITAPLPRAPPRPSPVPAIQHSQAMLRQARQSPIPAHLQPSPRSSGTGGVPSSGSSPAASAAAASSPLRSSSQTSANSAAHSRTPAATSSVGASASHSHAASVKSKQPSTHTPAVRRSQVESDDGGDDNDEDLPPALPPRTQGSSTFAKPLPVVKRPRLESPATGDPDQPSTSKPTQHSVSATASRSSRTEDTAASRQSAKSAPTTKGQKRPAPSDEDVASGESEDEPEDAPRRRQTASSQHSQRRSHSRVDAESADEDWNEPHKDTSQSGKLGYTTVHADRYLIYLRSPNETERSQASITYLDVSLHEIDKLLQHAINTYDRSSTQGLTAKAAIARFRDEFRSIMTDQV
ncbi:hypothetical protein, variant [Capsaspora owczarzaki ATCC 30864]|uniref:Uncharacterized protein n=1 Tax=Capsaspora owczarzaki (strain ATCC 30864) TaxID=595528 RepID=A0A0D2UIA4_CAPO3|nr:hypothetical protein, variant [Capsaspora owczarzaki ATCC 30864]